MATANKTVTAGDVVAATVKYSNKDNASRQFDITADVDVRDKRVQNIQNGQVAAKGSDTMQGGASATFSTWSENAVNYNVNQADRETQAAMFAEVQDFIAGVRASVEAAAAETEA